KLFLAILCYIVSLMESFKAALTSSFLSVCTQCLHFISAWRYGPSICSTSTKTLVKTRMGCRTRFPAQRTQLIRRGFCQSPPQLQNDLEEVFLSLQIVMTNFPIS